MSELTINDSSDSENLFNSDDVKDPVTLDAFQRSLYKMVRRKNKMDKRFIDLHRVSQAVISGVTLSHISSDQTLFRPLNTPSFIPKGAFNFRPK